MDRRSFTRITTLLGASFAVSGFKNGKILNKLSEKPKQKGTSVIGLKTAPIKQIRLGIIGLGNRGSRLLRYLTSFYPDKVIISSIYDVQPEKTKFSSPDMEIRSCYKVHFFLDLIWFSI